jgi:para-nitrobenzyl esterase
MYYFDQFNENGGFPGPGGQRRKPRGANHAAEMQYVFATPWGPFAPEDQKVSDAMHKYWGNFIKYGDPNGEGLDEWPVYDENGKTVMFFKNGTSLIETPNMPQLQLMEEFFKWKRENWKPRQ